MFWGKKKEDELKSVIKEGGNDKTAGLEVDTGKESGGNSDKIDVNELARLYDATVKDVAEGQIIKSRVIEIRPTDVVLDIGCKSEGVIQLTEFAEPDKLKIGDEVEVLLEMKENEHGSAVVSKQKADKLQGWERIVSTYKEGDIIAGKPSRKVKGGLMVDVGMEAFLPASLAGMRSYGNLDGMLGQEMEFKIIKINKARKNIVLSRKDVIKQRMEESRKKLLTELKKGQIVSGVVKNITDFGAFIDLGGLDGLLHITDISWGRISHPSEMLAIGDKVDVMVLDFKQETSRVSLGLKQKTPNPWEDVDKKYPIGSRIKGKIVNIMPYGAFVELEKGIEGLVHISSLSWSKRYSHPNELLAIGDVVEAVVLDMDKKNQKISLGIKQLEADPWLEAEGKFPVGTKVKGKVRNITDYGAFIELAEGVDGLVHVSEMSWTRKVGHPREILKKGQKVDAVVLSVDPKSRKLSLGLKQLVPDPWPKITKIYKEGYAKSGKITKITNFGIFVELEKDLEGLIHISEMEGKTAADLEAKYKVGAKLPVKVIEVDDSARKIVLTLEKK